MQAPYPDGTISQGGYSSHVRAHEYFTFKIPDKLSTEVAAPMLCAGITVYSPLVRLGCGPGKHVAIVGIGGLGHLAVLFAAALGAEVSVISHSPNKKEGTVVRRSGIRIMLIIEPVRFVEAWCEGIHLFKRQRLAKATPVQVRLHS